MLLLPARKILLHKELLVSSSWPFKMSIHKHALCDTCSGGTGARLRRCSRSSRKGPRNGPAQALTSMGEVQSTIYSGAIIQIFVGCSAMIKQRGFQRMRSLCDFPSPTVSTPCLQYPVMARSKIIVVWGLRVQNSSSFSNWESFMVLQSVTGAWGITQGPGGDKLLLPQASFQLS